MTLNETVGDDDRDGRALVYNKERKNAHLVMSWRAWMA